MNNKYKLLILVILVVIATIAATLYLNKNTSRVSVNDQIPTSLTKNILFEIYYPSKLPKDFEVNKDSFSFSQEVLTFTATNKNTGNMLTFNEQAKPPNFDYNILNRSIDNPQKISINPVESILGTNKYTSKKMLYSLGNNSLLIITSELDISEENWLLIAKNLSK